MSYNKVILIGNVGKDPDVHYIDTQNCIANFTLATNEGGYTKSNGDYVPEQTEWHNITTFRDSARFVEKHIRKGSRLMIEGKIRYRNYTDANGINRHTTEIIADKIQFFGSNPRRDRNTNEQSNQEGDKSPKDYSKYIDQLGDAEDPMS